MLVEVGASTFDRLAQLANNQKIKAEQPSTTETVGADGSAPAVKPLEGARESTNTAGKEPPVASSNGTNVAHATATSADKTASEQKAASRSSVLNDEAQILKPGQKVLAVEFENDGEPNSWWDEIIVRADAGSYWVRWRDWPDEPLVRRVPEHIAIKLSDL